MTEKPILFSAPMIRAILNGRKTQTRRVLKPSRGTTIADLVPTGKRIGIGELMEIPVDKLRVPVAVGDMLWVRERLDEGEAGSVVYHADGNVHPDAEWVWQRKSLPSIHCPRGLSRITIKVTAVKVERLQDISEEDAKAEGMIWQLPTAEDMQWAADNDISMEADDGVWIAPGTRAGIGMTKEQRGQPHWGPTAAFAFRKTWEAINGAESWAANPWCSCISFERIR